jgi:hypothetical protein
MPRSKLATVGVDGEKVPVGLNLNAGSSGGADMVIP